MAANPLSETLKLGVAAEPGAFSLSEEHGQELGRLADREASPGVGRPWADVEARLLGSE